MSFKVHMFFFAFLFSTSMLLATKKEKLETKQTANLAEILTNIAGQLEGQNSTQADYLDQINALFSTTQANEQATEANQEAIETNQEATETNEQATQTNATDIDSIAVKLNEIITALNAATGTTVGSYTLPSDS